MERLPVATDIPNEHDDEEEEEMETDLHRRGNAGAKTIKRERFDADDFFSEQGLCSNPECRQICCLTKTTKQFMDPDMIQHQRADIQSKISQLLHKQKRVNIYVLSDSLLEGSQAQLVADLFESFGATKMRVWAPSWNREVVSTCFLFLYREGDMWV
jgi:hypothetical protein